MPLNEPPAYTVLPLTPSARTVPKAVGSHAVVAPVAPSMAARRLRGCPPTVTKSPPTYTVPAFTATASTVVLAPGFQAVASPVVASSAAIRLRG